MKNFFLGVITTLLILFLTGWAYLRLGFAEVRGDLPPGNWETSLLTSAVHASVRRQAPEVPNPVAPTDENLIEGGKEYLGDCAGCHGSLDKPDKFDTEHSLFPPIPQLPKAGTEYTEAQIFWVAKHGIRRSGMFANGKWTPDDKLWSTAAFIKRIRSLPPGVQAALTSKQAAH
jgi:mono/diheme cytochrome c family protein